MNNIKILSLVELTEAFAEFGEKPYRAKQVFSWLWKGVLSFDEMTNLSKDLREKLKSGFYIGKINIADKQQSKLDETAKYLFQLDDGEYVESVIMKYHYGYSICISSQVGCKMGCKFCASGMAGFKRNLHAWEMLEQILAAERDINSMQKLQEGNALDSIEGSKSTDEYIRISRVVIMGIGEPLDNYENLKKFIHTVNDKDGLNLGMRNITVSTCGIIPKMIEFSRDFTQSNLAISLHNARNAKREEIMPITKKYPLAELKKACLEYQKNCNRRLSFEYALIAGVNDSLDDMKDLAKFVRGMDAYINLIPLNQVGEIGIKGSTRKKAHDCQVYLINNNVVATVRRELGADIDAACGQLRGSK
ncbi:MAG: 23S rRNA (adenine(2503)-C(2))-methyltransferase RlmN [Anaerovoracaceae bacterium]